jgi:hypothetical protein
MSGLPNLPAGLEPGLQKFLQKLGEKVEVADSDRGSPLNAKPTIQDLVDIGLIKANATQALKANGKTFSLQSARNWLSSAVPSWFTSLLNPPAPTGLVVAPSQGNLVLTWDANTSSYYGQTLIYRAATNDLSAAQQIGSTTGNTYVDNLPPTGGAYYYWIRTESKSKNLSDFNDILGTTVGNIVSAPSIAASFDLTDLVLSWPTPTSGLLIKYYIVRYGTTFTGGIDVGTANTNTLRLTVNFGGTRRFWIAGVDVNNQLGLSGYIDVTVVAPGAPTITQSIQNTSLVMTYAAAQGSLPVASYEIRYGASWAAGTSLLTSPSTRFEQPVNWTGSRTFWVGAYDTAGNLGTISQFIFTPVAPTGTVVSPQVVDNYVLLYWTAATGTLPVASYQIDRGGVTIGRITGLFTTVFETISATYTYGVTPIDSAGNFGTRATTSVTVAQPPDYQLFSNVDTDFIDNDTEVVTASIVMTNCIVDAGTGGLLCNVDTSETWSSHFTSRGWTTIQDQVDAGYSAFAVGKTTGDYTEAIDYGTTLASCKITMTPTPLFTSGVGVALTGQIETGVDGISWPNLYTGVSAYSTAFRYARYKLTFTAPHDGTGLATDSSGLLIIKPLNYLLDVKQKTYQGTQACLAADVGGTVVDITGVFVVVSSIVVSANSTTPLYVVYDFTSTPNPTQFKVLVFNTSGTRVNATVSYTLRGV